MLSETADLVEDLPGKYRYMAQLSSHHLVPKLTLVTEEDLSRWIENFGAVKQAVVDIEQHIAITSGAFLKNDLDKISQHLSTLRWSAGVEKDMLTLIKSVELPTTQFNLAVRSACQTEDSQQRSFAGIYDSVLKVDSVERLKEALLEVWRSAYSVRAIMEKLDVKLIGLAESMSIIVQQMVQPDISGVAFSCDPIYGEDTLYIEYVEGFGEALVSGERVSSRITEDTQLPTHQQVYHQLSAIVTSAKTLLGGHVDIEWAYQKGRVYLLQARPVTNIREEASSFVSHIASYDLYGDLPDSIQPSLPQYALYFNRKRKPLYDICRAFGCAKVGAVILEVNRHALDSVDIQQYVTSLFYSDRQVIDFADAVRQLVVHKTELITQLKSLMVDTSRINFIVIRDFVKGQYGVITQQVITEKGKELVAEVSEDGLLAMNRGSAVSQIFYLQEPVAETIFHGFGLSILHDVTENTLKILGDVQIEWVFSAGQFYAVDYSLVGENKVVLSDDTRVMSQGFARGQAFVMQLNEALESYSIAPSMSLTNIPDASVYGNLFLRHS